VVLIETIFGFKDHLDHLQSKVITYSFFVSIYVTSKSTKAYL